jgi:hypothetical protein
MARTPFHSGRATPSLITRIPHRFVIVCHGNHVSRAAASYRAQDIALCHRTLPTLPPRLITYAVSHLLPFNSFLPCELWQRNFYYYVFTN